LVLFVVGETPARGVNKAQLRDALDQIAWLAGWKHDAEMARPAYLDALVDGFRRANEVPIIGPTYSGSAWSIRATVDDWFDEPGRAMEKVRMFSGTATSVGDGLNDSHIRFSTVRLPDSVMLPVVAGDLERGIANLKAEADEPAVSGMDTAAPASPQIAILSDSTVYGSAAANLPGILRIAFPLHISAQRSAFGGSGSDSAKDTSAGQAEIGPENEAGETHRDTPPSFSAGTAAYNEVVLRTTLQTISQRHIRYVGVIASDINDLVFLVRLIRTYCPRATLFTTSSDLRSVRTDTNHDLDGLLVFSTYPLFPPNQQWTYPFKPAELQFSSEDGEGIFNATLAILGLPGTMVDCGAPFKSPPSGSRPVLWVGVMGNERIWPLGFQTLPEHDLAGVIWAGRAEAGDPMPPHLDLSALYSIPMEAAFFALSLLCLVPCYLLLRPELASIGKKPERSWGDMLSGDAALSEFQRERWMRIGAFIGGWMMAYAVAVIFLLLPLKAAAGIEAGKPIAVLIAAVCSMSFPVVLACLLAVPVSIALLAALGLALWRSYSAEIVADSREGISRAPTGAIFSLIGTLIGLGLLVYFLLGIWFRPPVFALLSFIRGANLGNRVSPLIPLAFLGGANLCLIGCDLWELSLLEDCRIELPFLGFEQGGESFQGTATYEGEVQRLLDSPPWALPGVLFFLSFSLFGLTGFALADGWPLIHSIDGTGFDWLFSLSALFIYTYFSLLLLRFVLVWGALHKLLRRLYWHPTRSCYEALRVKSLQQRPEDQRIRLVEPPSSLTAVESCLERARAMLRMSDRADSHEAHSETASSKLIFAREGLEAAIRSAELRVSEVLSVQEKEGWRAAVGKRVDMQKALETVSRHVVGILEPAWRLQPETHRFAASPLDEALLEQGELFIASRVVDFLRHIFIQLRGFAAFAMTGVLAMMLATSTYPFPNHNTLLWLSWVVLLSAIAICISVFVSINRDRVISMLSGTEPGRFNWDSTMVMRLLLYGVLPILALLGAQFPGGLGGVIARVAGLFGGSGQ
jgi:hypothetical protein